jgi:hypothetical protein
MNSVRRILGLFKEIEVMTVLGGAILLCFAAGYNMYPLVYPDTGTYIATGIESRVPVDRPLLYGLFLRHTSLRASLWFALFAQAIIVSSVLFSFIKTYFRTLPYHILYFVLLIPLIFCTALSIKTSTLIPDVFTPLPILCFFILLHGQANRLLRLWYIILIIFCLGTHQSHLMILTLSFLGYLVMLLFQRRFKMHLASWRRVTFLIPVVVIGFFITPVINSIYSGKFFWSKSSGIFFMGRFADNGMLQLFLKENCEQGGYAMCEYKDQIPGDFLWDNNSPLYKMGGWENPSPEFDRIFKEILTTPKYFSMFVYKSIEASITQFFSFQITVRADNAPMGADSPPHYAMRTVYSHESGSYLSANQNIGRLDYTGIDGRQTWLMIILVTAFLLSLLSGFREEIKSFIPVISMILWYTISNAVVCGTLSIPNPRYQTRVFWLIPLVLMMALIMMWIKPRLQHRNTTAKND